METSESEKGVPKSNAGVIVVGLLLALGAIAYTMQSNRSNQTANPSATSSPGASIEQTLEAAASPAVSASATGTSMLAEGENKVFNMKGDKFRFDPAAITVKAGDKVVINLDSIDMPHDFVIDELNVKSTVAQAGEKTTVEFVATKPGTYEYYCSVGSHRKMGMVGTLTVTE